MKIDRVFEADEFWVDYYHRYPLGGYLLGHGQQVVFLDTGLGGCSALLAHIEELEVQGYLLTHGHLDHAGNLRTLQEIHPAPCWCHPLETTRLEGRFPYRGWTRLCGWIEAFGRWWYGYREARADHSLCHGQLLDLWGGLEVVELPGHTRGHCGFYSARHRILFCGDLFANKRGKPALPPWFLNTCPELFPMALSRARELSIEHLYPNHCFGVSPNSTRPEWLAQL